MKKETVILSGIICLVLSLPGKAQTIDQSYAPVEVNFGQQYEIGAPLGQSFIPQTLTQMNFVQFLMSDQFPRNENGIGGTFQVQVRESDSLQPGVAGAILGQSELVALPDGFDVSPLFGGGIVDFTFLSPVSLTLNSVYTLELVRVSGDDFLLYGTQPGGYSDGAGIAEGGDADSFSDVQDYWFRQGAIATAPEPGTFALMMVGTIGLISYRARRRQRTKTERQHE